MSDPRTPHQAIDWAQAHANDQSWGGSCQMYVRESYNLPAVYGTAADQWAAPGNRYPCTSAHLDQVPYGAPVYFSKPGDPYGHTAMFLPPASVQSTDSAKPHPTQETVAYWEYYGYTFLGWRDNVSAVPIPELVKAGQGGSTDNDKEEDGFVDFDPQTRTKEFKFPANGDWHGLPINNDDDYSIAHGPNHFILTASASFTGIEKGTEVNVRAVIVKFKDTDHESVEQEFPAGPEAVSHGSTTQTQYSMQGHLDKTADGYSHRLRIQARAYHGKPVATHVSTKVTLW